MNYKRGYPRTVGSPGNWNRRGSRSGDAPRWYALLFDKRPAKRRDKAKIRKIMQGKDPDELLFELSSRKPHKYYW